MQIRELSFVSKEPITSLVYTRYRLRLNQAVDNDNLPGELGRLAVKLKWRYKLPILSDPSNSAILIPVSVSLSNDSELYEIIGQEDINLADLRYQRFLFQVCNFALFRAFDQATSSPKVDRYRKRIYSGKQPSGGYLNETNTVEAQRYLTFDFICNQDQYLVLIIDFASEYYSHLTLDEFGLDKIHTDDKIIHNYDGKACYFICVGEENISTPLVELGNNSVIQYHQQKGNLSTPLPRNIDVSTPVVKVRYFRKGNKDFEAAHMPQLLRKVYDRTEVDNYMFNQQLWSIQEKVDKAIGTIKFLNSNNRFNLNGMPITFSDSLRKPEKLQDFLRGSNSRNLDFGKEVVAKSNDGLKKGYLWQKPDQIKAFILYPHNLKEKVNSYIDSFKKELSRFGVKLLRNLQSYNPRNALEINKICQKIGDCDLVIAFVPESEHKDYLSEVTPYKRIKTQLIKRRIPSQMINCSTLNKGWKRYIGQNLILGINAKLGYLSWRLNKMPGTVQAFIGLDIGRKNNRAVGASAFVIDACGELIGWSNQELRAYKETFDPEGLRNLLLDLFGLYQKKYQSPLNHLVIHRDGELKNSEYKVLVDLQSQLKSKGLEYLDVVEVIKSGTCRAVKLTNGGKYDNPEKGYAWQHCHNEAIIMTTGKDEAKVSRKSSPRPLRIRRRIGETDLLILAEQVYWLSEMQVGSTQTIRLPITTYYADRAAECALEYLLPSSITNDKCLWFL
ncbi:MAG: hypothetical protein F6K10_33875 [Moorea sp. SIO2B7]|nr:hypothetical protein [Moorena sp. SIO2B7]